LATWRKLVLGALFVVLVGGLVGILAVRQSDDKGQAQPPPAPAPQTTAVTTPADNEQPPPLLNTGEDWTAIMRSIEGYFDWLERHPDPNLLANIDHPQDALFADTQNALRELASGQWHYERAPGPTVVESVVVSATLFEGRQVQLFVGYGPGTGHRIVDSAGNIVNETPPSGSKKAIVVLVHDPNDSRWRILKSETA
jgi:hypothetical protein